MTQPHHLAVRLAPTDNAPEPRIHLRGGVPSIDFYALESFVQFELVFSMLSDPSGYLRDLAADLNVLADRIDATPKEVSA